MKFDFEWKEKLGKVCFYEEHLKNAKSAGYRYLSDWIEALHKEHDGKALRASKAVGVRRGTMIRWFRQLGLSTLSRGGSRAIVHPRRTEVGKLYKRTKSCIKVGKELGVSHSTIAKWLKEDGMRLAGRCDRFLSE